MLAELSLLLNRFFFWCLSQFSFRCCAAAPPAGLEEDPPGSHGPVAVQEFRDQEVLDWDGPQLTG